MATTPNLGITLIEQGQSQKEVTMNEAITILDAALSGGIIDKDLTAPPGSPVAGARYIVAATATGAWAGKENKIAYYFNGGWRFLTPGEGLFVWMNDENLMYVFNGTTWTSTVGAGNMLGVNTTADTTNRLAVRTNAALLTALYAADGGNGDMQIKVNKEGVADIGSFLFQRNFSSRAEFGLLGDDNFTLKTSPDGSTWLDTLKMIAATGRVAFKSIGAGLSAAGTTQGTATVLTKSMSEITTVAANTGVLLPTPEPGELFFVANKGANALRVYPSSGGYINGLAVDTFLSVPVDTRRLFFAVTATQWYSI